MDTPDYGIYRGGGGTHDPGNTGRRRMVRAALEALGPVRPGAYLDVGTGGGLMAVAVAKAHPRVHVVGVDIWTQRDLVGNSRRRAVRNARLEGVAHRVEFRRGDARRLAFRSNSFDGVVSSLTIHNLPFRDRPRAFREVARVVKSGGRFAYLDLEFKGDGFQNFYNLRRLLRSVGFEDVRFRTVADYGDFVLKILGATRSGE